MNTIQYSPFNHYNEQNTDQKQTTSYKKYPANKYMGYDDPTDDIKHRLFAQQKYSNQQNQKEKSRQINDRAFFKNDRIHQVVNAQHSDSIVQDLSGYYPIHKSKKSHDNNYSFNYLNKLHHPPKPKSKKSKQLNKPRTQRTKSCHLSIKPTKIPISSSVQQKQQLQMYKKLCITLRKQNQDLSTKISKQQNQQSKFSSQIQSLKQKIKKMYDHCIEKNKSAKNVDFSLEDLIHKHTNKENLKSKANDKENIHIQLRKLHKSNQLKIDRQKHSKVDKIIDKKSNNQTIDTTRTSKKDFNTSHIKQQKSFRKKNLTTQIMMQSNQKKISVSSRFIKNESTKYPAQLIQYDQESQPQLGPNQPLPQHKNEYKQFFSTFVKSLQIFQTNTSQQHKSKTKMLKQGGYYIQWAKQQWLQIVQYLIKKGYVSGHSLSKKTKRTQDDHKTIR